ncbi:hypothetical protein [Flavobacterium capsici]|uniref:Uncharacterized protein n=1 Tax=Flavobacterium capsici TaxID=3075618 RepID=A0AA96F0I5_9FLAO|nr:MULTISPECIES: hypothetical protein [unclassified Flavobacterium]WNM19121.1 hypothetical protein RN608_00210 [Flavobacterium sp. PMR2A8]WNM20510.1 hypothetical protein RN605_07380 [Flavobacterium sp. PMTSA4]
MAKQKGIIHFVGTINGVNFYIRKGKPVARRAGGGFNGSAIKKKPSMARIRENNSEFGTTSSAKKLFKDSLAPFLGNVKDSVLQGALMQLFIKIKNCDLVSERGKRSVPLGIESSEGKQFLENFEFTSLKLPYSNSYFDEVTSTFTITDFNVKGLKYPKGATHLKLQLGIVSLDFDAKNKFLFASSPLLIPKNTDFGTISMEAAVPPDLTGIRVAVFYYRYTQDLNGLFYDLKDKTAYGIVVLKVY